MMKSARTSIENPARNPRPRPAPPPPCDSPAPANPTGSFVPYPLFPPIVLLRVSDYATPKRVISAMQ